MLKLNILTPKEHIFGKNMPTNQVWCDASNGATCGREEETEKGKERNIGSKLAIGPDHPRNRIEIYFFFM